MARLGSWLVLAVAAIGVAAGTSVLFGVDRGSAPRPDAVRGAERYGALPTAFEANRGQTDPRVEYVAHGSRYALYVTSRGATLALPKAAVRLRLVGGTPGAAVGVDRLPGAANYLIGQDRSRWHVDIPTFGGVRLERVYPGIDLAFHGTQGRLEYDFLLAPGADPRVIDLRFDGAEQVAIDRGDLLLTLPGGALRQPKPVAYQVIGGRRERVGVTYVLRGGSVRLRLAAYDRSRPLVIDPSLVYSTYLGGSEAETGAAIAVDADRNAYVTGTTFGSADFPTTPGAYDGTLGAPQDAFVTKLNASGTALVYSTYLGGTAEGAGHTDNGFGIAVDGDNNAYVTGDTNATDFPTTPGAFDTTADGSRSAFVAKLDSTGSTLLYSTFLGGPNDDAGRGIAVDTIGNAYITGEAGLDAFVSKLSPAGSALVYSISLGGSGADFGQAIAVDGTGNAYVTGATLSGDFPTTAGAYDAACEGGTLADGFVAKLGSLGAVLYSTCLGGTGFDAGVGIAVDGTGSAYVVGATDSTDFPTTPGALDATDNPGSDAFVTKLDPSASGLVYSTLLGGNADDDGEAIALDGGGNAYVTGRTTSTDFPTTAGAFDRTANGDFDVYVTRLNAAGDGLRYSTYLGGDRYENGLGIAADAVNGAYVTGVTAGGSDSPTEFPTTSGAYDTTFAGQDAFVSKLDTIGVAAPKSKADCKNGGWATFRSPSFRNQGQCVRYVTTH